MGNGTVTLIPVLVLFHFPAVTVPPVVMTDPTVKSAGTVVSIIKSLLTPKELVAPGLAKVNVAAFPDTSEIVFTLVEIMARPAVEAPT